MYEYLKSYYKQAINESSEVATRVAMKIDVCQDELKLIEKVEELSEKIKLLEKEGKK